MSSEEKLTDMCTSKFIKILSLSEQSELERLCDWVHKPHEKTNLIAQVDKNCSPHFTTCPHFLSFGYSNYCTSQESILKYAQNNPEIYKELLDVNLSLKYPIKDRS